MQLYKNFSLKNYNTFAIDAYAKYFTTFSSTTDLQNIFQSDNHNRERILVLGGGSNILFTNNFDGLVLRNEIKGIETIHEDERHVYVKAGAGENWHQFVLHCINKNFSGTENLSLIPGNVGASPMQNIGAYGAEIKDIFFSLEAYHLEEKKIITFTLNDCEFGYRESIFKKKYKDQFVILNVIFRLSKIPVYNISYGAIEDELNKMQVKSLSIKLVSNAIINIRRAKLPDPKFVGNAGSFFKNPLISSEQLQQLLIEHPAIPAFQINESTFKIPAGWLIEQCGWKGYRKNDAGCYDKQALVLINYGKASGKEILDLSKEIKTSIYEKFKVMLEKEVNVI